MILLIIIKKKKWDIYAQYKTFLVKLTTKIGHWTEPERLKAIKNDASSYRHSHIAVVSRFCYLLQFVCTKHTGIEKTI